LIDQGLSDRSRSILVWIRSDQSQSNGKSLNIPMNQPK